MRTKSPVFKPSDAVRSGLLLLPLVAIAVCGIWWLKGQPQTGDRPQPSTTSGTAVIEPSDIGERQEGAIEPGAPGFRNAAAANGLDFQMTFLAGEQGESFKINLYDHGCGLAVADYDGDGDDDVLLLNQLGTNALYRNRGDGSFERVTDATTVALADRICVGAALGDYDNDGDQDLYITSTRGGNVLLRNDGGRFVDVGEEAGVALVAHSQTPAFFDYDNDGDLDLYVTNSAKWTSDEFNETDGYYVGPRYLAEFLAGGDTELEYNVLYRNDGNGRFSDVTDEAGVQGRGWCGDVAVFDYDQDGHLDLFVANMFGLGQLYHNDGRGHFQDVTRDTLRQTSFGAIGSKAFDYDNDGRLDLFVTDMHSDMWQIPEEASLVEEHQKRQDIQGRWQEILLSQFGDDYHRLFLFGNSLFHNEGQGTFTECSDAAGMETFWPWGIAVGDFDNDGDEDVFLPSGMGYPFYYWPNYLMSNNGNGTFTNRAAQDGIEPPHDGLNLPQPIGGKPAARSSRCAATADFDGDGRLDLIVNNFNDHPYCFKNGFPARHYVAFRLRGTRSNRDAIGAMVTLQIGEKVMVRQVHCSGGYLSQSSKMLHFGLGEAANVDWAEIRWPSGTVQIVDVPTLDKLYEVSEALYEEAK